MISGPRIGQKCLLKFDVGPSVPSDLLFSIFFRVLSSSGAEKGSSHDCWELRDRKVEENSLGVRVNCICCVELFIEGKCFNWNVTSWSDSVEILFCECLYAFICLPFLFEWINISSTFFSLFCETGFRSDFNCLKVTLLKDSELLFGKEIILFVRGISCCCSLFQVC